MDLPIVDNITEPYVKFCQENGLKVCKVPTNKKEMGLQQELMMRESAPELFQNIVKPSVNDLPADTKLRYQSQQFWIEDIKPLQEAGFTGVAAGLVRQVEEGKAIAEAKKLEEMKQRNAEVAKRNANKPVGFHPTRNIDFNSAEAVRARRQWGLSDNIG